MSARRVKLILILVLVIFVLFFSNDFGLIDVEKTSIITAIAVDKADDGDYLVTAQIAVPEATDKNSENLKAQISGKNSTVGGAIKNLSDLSGWFPKLTFCNLIIIGNKIVSQEQDNVIKIIDYFSKSLRVQDSALVAVAENNAYELLDLATPLDNISSFALQKILLKNTGFDKDIASCDIKTFCSGHYSSSGSAYMPIIKPVKAGVNQQSSQGESQGQGSNSSSSSSQSSSGGQGNDSNKNNLFDAKTTALFVHGIKVGELSSDLTLVFNALNRSFRETTLSVDHIDFNGQDTNYLLTVLAIKPSVKLIATDNDLVLKINLSLYCKVSDHSADNSEQALFNNIPIPNEVELKAEELLKTSLEELVETCKQTKCDILKIKEKLYRYNHKQYSRYKDNYLEKLQTDITVSVSGQK